MSSDSSGFEALRRRNEELLAQVPQLASQVERRSRYGGLATLVDEYGWQIHEIREVADSWPDAPQKALGYLLSFAGMIRNRYGVAVLGDVIAWTHAICQLDTQGHPVLTPFVARQLKSYRLRQDPSLAVALYVKCAGSADAALAGLLAGRNAAELRHGGGNREL